MVTTDGMHTLPPRTLHLLAFGFACVIGVAALAAARLVSPQLDAATVSLLKLLLIAPLTISSIATNGPFMLHPGANACGTTPITLSSGQSCNVFVGFQTMSPGMFSGEVVIASNASATPARVMLTAQGVTAGGGGATETSNVGFGGCSLGAPDRLVDPLLAIMLAIAVFVVLRRRVR